MCSVEILSHFKAFPLYVLLNKGKKQPLCNEAHKHFPITINDALRLLSLGGSMLVHVCAKSCVGDVGIRSIALEQ